MVFCHEGKEARPLGGTISDCDHETAKDFYFSALVSVSLSICSSFSHQVSSA